MWLKWRPRGTVIMPASKTNAGFTHSQVVRYDGKNWQEVDNLLKSIVGNFTRTSLG